MAKKKNFHVYAKVLVYTAITVKAESLEDALAKSKSFSTTNFVDIKDEHIDSQCKITGVYEEYEHIKIN